jgi:hypothetical protein
MSSAWEHSVMVTRALRRFIPASPGTPTWHRRHCSCTCRLPSHRCPSKTNTVHRRAYSYRAACRCWDTGLAYREERDPASERRAQHRSSLIRGAVRRPCRAGPARHRCLPTPSPVRRIATAKSRPRPNYKAPLGASARARHGLTATEHLLLVGAVASTKRVSAARSSYSALRQNVGTSYF